MKRATEQIARVGPTFLTVHAVTPVMRAAMEGRGESGMKLLGVTVLTSFDDRDVADLGYDMSLADLITHRVKQCVDIGIDGMVCSPLEVARVRVLAGSRVTLVTPGVRSAGADAGDQKRVATPREAMRRGANYLVIGREVTRAADPRAACESILAELALRPGWDAGRALGSQEPAFLVETVREQVHQEHVADCIRQGRVHRRRHWRKNTVINPVVQAGTTHLNHVHCFHH